MSTAETQEQPTDCGILSPDQAGTLFVPNDEQKYQELRSKLNDAIRATHAAVPVILGVPHVRLSIAKRLARDCEQAGWVAQILPLDGVSQDHALQTGSVLKLTKPAPSTGDGETRP